MMHDNMMHENGYNYMGGMPIGWWIFIALAVIAIAIWQGWFRKRK